MQPGDIITFRSLHADGLWYRRWETMVESVSATCIVTYSAPPCWVEDVKTGRRAFPRAMRSYYWTDRFYNLIEVLDPDGSLVEVYINIASPLRAAGGELHFIDHELDVTKPAGEPARIIDQDEFAEAIGRYGYSADFQAQCWLAAEEARQLADTWTIGGHSFRT